MKEERKIKVYKIVMLAVLVAFITFLVTSIGMYEYLTGNDLIKNSILTTTSNNNSIDKKLQNYKKLLKMF